MERTADFNLLFDGIDETLAAHGYFDVGWIWC